VKIYRRDAAGREIERIEAASATYGPQGWRLNAPKFVRFDAAGPHAGQAAQMTWAQKFEPADVQALFFGDENLSAASARRALRGGGGQRPQSYYATRLQRAIAAPIGCLVMLLLTVPIALASFRSSKGAVFVATSLSAGLLFIVLDGLLSALGEGGATVAATSGRPIAANEKVHVVVRPERLRIVRDDEPALVAARVRESMYVGGARRYEATSIAGERLVIVETDLNLPVVPNGDEVKLGWDPAFAWVIGADETAPADRSAASGAATS